MAVRRSAWKFCIAGALFIGVIASVPRVGAVEPPAVFRATLICAGPGPVHAVLAGGIDMGGGLHGDILMSCDQDHRVDVTTIHGPDATRIVGFGPPVAISDGRPMPCVQSGPTWRCASGRNSVMAVILQRA